jgi:hypothetical protein
VVDSILSFCLFLSIFYASDNFHSDILDLNGIANIGNKTILSDALTLCEFVRP